MIRFFKNGIAAIKCKTTAAKQAIAHIFDGARATLTGTAAEGYVDTAVKILMAVVIGALLLAGLYLLFGDTVLFSSRSKHDRKCYA
jgi:hypothetical protein